MTDNENPGFFIEEDLETLQYLFGDKKDEKVPPAFTPISKADPDAVSNRAPDPIKREAPAFPTKTSEREVVTFTPKRSTGKLASAIKEKLGMLIVSGISLGILGGIAYIVYAVLTNYVS